MSPRVRATRCPLAVNVVFLLGSAGGAALLLTSAISPAGANPAAAASATTPHSTPAARAGLQPATLMQALQAVLPTDAADPRVSGAYGSGHHGS